MTPFQWTACFHIFFSFPFQALLRNYELEIEQLTKQQKMQVEKAELSQAADRKTMAKKLKLDQVRICVPSLRPSDSYMRQ